MSTAEVPLEDLFRNLQTVEAALGRSPRQQDMHDRQRSRYTAYPYLKRFDHKWNNVIEAYRRWQEAHGHAEASQPPPVPRAPQRPRPPQKPRAASHAHNDTYGDPIDFRGMRYAPTNRDGVLFLFSKIHLELGMLVEHLRVGGYPDCEARRQDPKTHGYTKCSITFELHSSAFQRHVSRQEQCHLVVCWEHDWPGCPIEVLALKDAIATLLRAGGERRAG
jgi:hypothetical protein